MEAIKIGCSVMVRHGVPGYGRVGRVVAIEGKYIAVWMQDKRKNEVFLPHEVCLFQSSEDQSSTPK